MHSTLTGANSCQNSAGVKCWQLAAGQTRTRQSFLENLHACLFKLAKIINTKSYRKYFSLHIFIIHQRQHTPAQDGFDGYKT